MNAYAIIPAAGSGTRIGEGMPKQYIPLAGVPLLTHTLHRFQRSPLIDEIIVVVRRGEVTRVRREIVAPHDLPKVRRIVEGGAERQDSVSRGLKEIWDDTGDDDIVIVHDGARPFVDEEGIARCIHEARECGACILGLRITETPKCVNDGGIIMSTPSLNGLWVAQTPQAFRASVLKEAHSRARSDGFYGTDEASLVERLPHPVRIVQGSIWNIKVTHPGDLAYAECILRMGVCP